MTEAVTYRIGVDIGGTFTDLVVVGSDGSLWTRKVSSTPEDYGRAIVDGIVSLLEEANVGRESVESLVHATTVATNAILEMAGARTALVTTAGFRDVLEMRRLRIPEMYNLQYEPPRPLVPRRFRFEVSERMGPGGTVRQALDESDVRAVARRVGKQRIEAVAICLLNAYADPAHEEAVERILREEFDDGVYIARSSYILPEIREYERTSTTVVSAYIGPVVARYLGRLRRQLSEVGVSAPLHVMQSNGGAMSSEAAVRRPAYIVESGPAAGVIACAAVARRTGHPNVISLDMGGTTAKAAIVENGEPAKTTEYEVGTGINLSSKLVKGGGYAIKLPFIDVSEIGAGGGSIVSVGSEGTLRVGPHSAGAVPGPVCYDIGGTEPTFTDAMVALGYLNPHHLVGGAVRLNADKARAVLEARVARPLRKSLTDAAYGVYTLAAATMTRAVKAVSTYRGRDPRDFVLVAFGGNGPVAAIAIARELQMRRVLVPPAPGVFSALGLPSTEIEHEFIHTFFVRSDEIRLDDVERAFAALEAKARAEMAQEGAAPGAVALTRLADLRYAGQAYELTVLAEGTRPDLADMFARFHREHARTYGHASQDDPVDLVNVKVLARLVTADGRRFEPAPATAAKGGRGTRAAYFGPDHGVVETSVIGRGDLTASATEGPLIVEEYDSTCVVPPGVQIMLDEHGNIQLSL